MTERGLARVSVTLKLATSLDGAIATQTGQSKWITGPQSRAHVHRMRTEHDCVLTGIGTVLADDPEMTARTVPLPDVQPLRAVLDSKARTPATARLLATSDIGDVCLFHDHKRTSDIPAVHRRCVGHDQSKQGLDLHQVLTTLENEFGVKTIMVEAGPKVAGAFLRAGLVDRVVWFRAPIIIGGDGLSVFSALGVDKLAQASVLDRLSLQLCGDDVMEIYNLKNKD